MYEKLSLTLQTLRGMYDFKENILRIGCINSSEVIGALREAVKDFGREHPDILIKIESVRFYAAAGGARLRQSGLHRLVFPRYG